MGTAPEMLSFKDVETVLARTFGVDDRYRGLFVERLKHLRKLGSIEATPGKGQVVAYDRDQILRLMLILELSEAGYDASLITETIRPLWPKLAEMLDIAQRFPTPVFLAVRPSFMTGAWRGTPFELAWYRYGSLDLSVLKKSNKRTIRIPDLSDYGTTPDAPLPKQRKMPVLDWLTPEQPRLTLINISARLERFNQALADVSKKTPVDNKKRRRS
jgi:hypothetical protein